MTIAGEIWFPTFLGLERKADLRHFRALIPYFRRHRWFYVFGVGALLGADLAQLVLPQVLKRFVNTVQQAGAVQADLWPYAVALVVLAVIIFATRFLWRNFVQGAARLIDFEMRQDLFHQFTLLSPNYFNHHKTGDLMAHATNDLQAVRMALSMGVVMIADTAFLITSTLIIMFATISPSLATFALLPLPLAALVTGLLGRQIHLRFRAVQDQFSTLSEHVQENFSGIRVVKSFVQEGPELDRLMGHSQEYFARNMNLVRIWALIQPLVQFIQGLAFVIALVYGGILVVRNTISLGSFVAFTSYLGLLNWPMQSIGQLVNLIQRSGASLQRLQEIFSERPEITDRPGAVAPETPLSGALTISHLTFSYPDSNRPAIADVSVDLAAGRTLALIGRTGAGKSTIINLLLRVFDPPPGTVFVDQIDILDLPLLTLRQTIAYVPPDNFLFSESIAQNIAFSDSELGRDIVEQAAADAAVKGEILQFPDGFETLLGERGVTLSGGHKQRVSLARALAKTAQVLILDDSFSAVDTYTEETILRGLLDLRQNRTTLLVAHRVSTIKHADLILVLEDGRVIEQGTHAELLAKKGFYSRLYQRQLLEDRVGGSPEGRGA